MTKRGMQRQKRPSPSIRCYDFALVISWLEIMGGAGNGDAN